MAIVLTVGSLHYDILVEADHLPRKDETAAGTRWYPKFGGKGGNQAVAAARAGAESRMVGALGNDDFGVFLGRRLKETGVDDRFVRITAGVGSGMSVAIQDHNGDYAATIVSGANLHIDPAILASPEIWQGVGLLILQNEVTEAINLVAAYEARRRGIPVLLNAAPFRLLSMAMRGLVDILIVNAVEAEMMGTDRVDSLHAAATAARILAKDYPAVIVTAGANGLAYCGKSGHAFELPAERIDAISSHGAGDAFVGTFATLFANAASLEEACKAASIAAASHVSGGRSSAG